MTKHTQPKAVQRYLHVGIREAYSWEDHDFTAEEAGAPLYLQMLITPRAEAPEWSGSTCHLYSEPLHIPVPSFDPIEKRLAAVDNELADLRRQFYRRKEQLEEQRQNILAITGPAESEE